MRSFLRKTRPVTADEAYNTLPLSLVTTTPILAWLVAEGIADGTLPAEVA